LIFGKDMDKSKVARFSGPPCITTALAAAPAAAD